MPKGLVYNDYRQKIELKSDGGSTITWSAEFPEALKDLSIDQTGEIYECPRHIFKGSVPIIATNHLGKSVIQNVKLTITANKPKITISSLPAAKVGEEYKFTLQASGSPVQIWSGTLPDGLSINDSGDISGTPTTSDKKFKAVITVKNEAGSNSKKFTLVVNEADSENKTSREYLEESESESQESEFESPAPTENELQSEKLESESESENNLTLGSGALSLVSNDDYMIACILPDVKVNESGIYEFTVSLDKSVPENSVLIWHSFPNGQVSDSEDDNSAIFFNDDGEEIYNVPEDYYVTVSAWFEAGITYKPVISVKK